MKMSGDSPGTASRMGKPDLRQALTILQQAIAAGHGVQVLSAVRTAPDSEHLLLHVETPDGAAHRVFTYLSPVGEPRYVDQLAGAFVRQRCRLAGETPPPVALFVARSLGPGARRRCQELGINYLATANRSYLISLGSYHYEREGDTVKPLRRRGGGELITRARVQAIRALLCRPAEEWDQVVLARRAGVSVSTVNGLVGMLVDRQYGERSGRGPRQKFRLTKARELLEEWAAYWPRVARVRHRYYARYSSVDQFAHRLAVIARAVHQSEVKGHVNARLWESPSSKPAEWQRALDQGLLRRVEPLALSGLSAASFIEEFVRYRTIEAYTAVDPSQLANSAEMRAVEDEPNVILIQPPDYGILAETVVERAIPIVCPAQLYVDLMAAGGRAASEAAPIIQRRALEAQETVRTAE